MKLGDKARCKITGATGILTARTSFLTGCDRWTITSEFDPSNDRAPQSYVDVMAVEVIESGAVRIPVSPEVPSAG